MVSAVFPLKVNGEAVFVVTARLIRIAATNTITPDKAITVFAFFDVRRHQLLPEGRVVFLAEPPLLFCLACAGGFCGLFDPGGGDAGG